MCVCVCVHVCACSVYVCVAAESCKHHHARGDLLVAVLNILVAVTYYIWDNLNKPQV